MCFRWPDRLSPVTDRRGTSLARSPPPRHGARGEAERRRLLRGAQFAISERSSYAGLSLETVRSAAA